MGFQLHLIVNMQFILKLVYFFVYPIMGVFDGLGWDYQFTSYLLQFLGVLAFPETSLLYFLIPLVCFKFNLNLQENYPVLAGITSLLGLKFLL